MNENTPNQLQKAYIMAKAMFDTLQQQQWMEQTKDSGLRAQLLDAGEKLLQAEEELLTFGLNVMPQRGREILKKAVNQNLQIRSRVIDFALKLDERSTLIK